jgi:hypothetical protein
LVRDGERALGGGRPGLAHDTDDLGRHLGGASGPESS